MKNLDVTQAALKAINNAGFVVVPKEPTEAMKHIGHVCLIDNCISTEIYKAMIGSALNEEADEIEKQRWQLDNALRKRNELETEIEMLRTALRTIAEETREALDND